MKNIEPPEHLKSNTQRRWCNHFPFYTSHSYSHERPIINLDSGEVEIYDIYRCLQCGRKKQVLCRE